MSPIKLLWNEFSEYKILIGILVFLMWVKSTLDALLPLVLVPIFAVIGAESLGSSDFNQLDYLYQFIDYVQSLFGLNDEFDTALFLALVIVVTKMFFAISFEFVQNFIIYTYEHKRRSKLFSLLLGVNWTFYLNQKAGNIINTLHTEIGRAGQVFSGLISLLDAVLLIVLYLLVATYISWESTLFAFGAFIILVFIVIPAARKAKIYGQEAVYARENLMHHFNQLIYSFKVLKGSRMESAAQKFVVDASARCRFFYIRMGIVKILPGTMFEPVIIFAIIALVFAAREFPFITLAQAGAVVIILYRCLNKSVVLQKFWVSYFECLPSLRLVNSLPNVYTQNKEERPAGLIETIQSMNFEYVTYQYPSGKVPALSRISLDIKQGDYIGIVGVSGSGKTTLVDTLLYLLKPVNGSIKVNDKDLIEVDPWNWREHIGYVPQESIMFNDTIKNNIALYRPNVTDEDIVWAAKIANADEFINDLPEKYDTVVGERGSRLSGGQRQRLALARALVNKPQLLLLDEATSALDTFTEKKIQESVDQLKGQFTIIVIAHRLSTLLNADRIIVLEDGKIVQSGTPDSLINEQGNFQQMYNQQFQGSTDPSVEPSDDSESGSTT